MTFRSNLISKSVRKVLEKDTMSIIAIMNKIANPRKISRRIMKDVAKDLGFEPNLGSVSRVVERYVKQVEKSGKLAGYDIKKIRSVFGKTRVILRSDIAVLEIRMSSGIEKKLVKIIEHVYSRKEKPFLGITYGHSYITILIDQDNMEKIKKIIGSGIVSSSKNQAALSIITPSEVLNVPGFASYAFSILGLNGINISEILSSYNEGILVLDGKEADHAYKVLINEIKKIRSI